MEYCTIGYGTDVVPCIHIWSTASPIGYRCSWGIKTSSLLSLKKSLLFYKNIVHVTHVNKNI